MPFEVNGSRLYLGDSREVLERENISADLIVTDPPYGVEFRSNWGKNFERIANDQDDDMVVVDAVVAAACARLREHRHAYVFGPLADRLPEKMTARVGLIWDKDAMSMGDLSLPFATSHEPIVFAVKVSSSANRSDGRGKLSARMRKSSVLRVPRKHSGANRRHPTEKPVELLRILIESSSSLGETVLDPFVGCGSTIIAAMLEGRRGVGIELEPRYFEVAKQRMEAVARWLDQLADP